MTDEPDSDEPLRVAVIVPTLNEQDHLGQTLSRVDLGLEDELIVVDGGSTDDTVAIARQFTTQVLSAPPGRARQMNHAARRAQGDVLLFLHADTLLPPDGLNAVRRAMRQKQIGVGAFRLSFTPSTPALRLIAWGANLRSRFGKLPYGDQALFVRRSLFEAVGGYADMPFLEDVRLVRTLRRQGALVVLPSAVQTSGRRWQRDGLVYTTMRNNILLALYGCGVSPATLKQWYR